MEISVSKECIAHAKDKMQKAILHLEDELKNFRAGKANPLAERDRFSAQYERRHLDIPYLHRRRSRRDYGSRCTRQI